MQPELKTIATNTAAQGVAKASAVLLTLITTVMILRLGGQDLFGDLTKSLALIAIGFTAIDFGLNAEVVRSMTGSKSYQIDLLKNTIITRQALSVITIVALNLFVFTLQGGYTPAIKSAFWVGSLAILFQGQYTSYNAWFQRHLSYWRSATSTIAGTLVGTLLTIYFLITNPTIFNLLLASTLGYLVMAATSSYQLQGAFTNWRDYAPSRLLAVVGPTLKRALPLGTILILSVLASKIDTIILGVFRSSGEVGEYGLAYRIFDVALVVPAFIMNSVYPLLVSLPPVAKKRLISRSTSLLLVLSLFGAIALFFLAPAVSLIKGELKIATSSLRLLALSLPLFYLSSPLMWQLVEARLEHSLLKIYLFGAILNAGLNLVLIPRFGAPAAAATTFVTELIILLSLAWLRSRRREL